MQLLQAAEFAVADTVARLLDCNPFLAERVELERHALGPAFVPTGPVWHSADHAGSAAIGPASAATGDLGARMGDATITVDELRDRYIKMTYARLGSFHRRRALSRRRRPGRAARHRRRRPGMVADPFPAAADRHVGADAEPSGGGGG